MTLYLSDVSTVEIFNINEPINDPTPIFEYVSEEELVGAFLIEIAFTAKVNDVWRPIGVEGVALGDDIKVELVHSDTAYEYARQY